MVIQIVKNEIKPGTAEQYIEAAKDFMSYVKENCPGCLEAGVMQDQSNENIVANLVKWESSDDLKNHLAGDALSKFADRLFPFFVSNTTEIYRLQ